MAQLKKREKILVASAGLILMFFVINQFLCSKEKEPKKIVVSQKSEVSTAAKPEPEVKKSSQTISRQHKKDKTEYKAWGRDPFYEAYRLVSFSAKTDSSNFRLHGIIKKGNEAYVLIGDAILKKGESDGDLSIIDISKDRVVCRKGRRVLTLALSDEK